MSRSHFGTPSDLPGLDNRQNHADGEQTPQSEPFDAELYVLNYFQGDETTRLSGHARRTTDYKPLSMMDLSSITMLVWLSKDNHLGIQTYMRHNNDVSTLEQAAELKEYLHMAQDSVIATSAQRTLSRQQVRQLRDNNPHSSLRKNFEKFDLEDDVEAHLSIMTRMLPYVEEETKHLTGLKKALEASKRRGKLDDMKMERTTGPNHGAGISPLRSVLLDVSGFSVASLPNVGDEEEFNEFEDDWTKKLARISRTPSLQMRMMSTMLKQSRALERGSEGSLKTTRTRSLEPGHLIDRALSGMDGTALVVLTRGMMIFDRPGRTGGGLKRWRTEIGGT
ncbi:hypothetical protein E4T47_05654 [Aureobasidium subglaciale]|nr:hypothetical protein E4T47_05654 [Aureobasidium subglaciale]